VISEETFRGGAAYQAISGDFSLVFGANRAWLIHPTTTSLAVVLPSALNIPTGGPRFVIMNVGVPTLDIEDAGNNTLVTLAQWEAAEVYLSNNATANGTWYCAVNTFNLIPDMMDDDFGGAAGALGSDWKSVDNLEVFTGSGGYIKPSPGLTGWGSAEWVKDPMFVNNYFRVREYLSCPGQPATKGWQQIICERDNGGQVYVELYKASTTQLKIRAGIYGGAYTETNMNHNSQTWVWGYLTMEISNTAVKATFEMTNPDSQSDDAEHAVATSGHVILAKPRMKTENAGVAAWVGSVYSYVEAA